MTDDALPPQPGHPRPTPLWSAARTVALIEAWNGGASPAALAVRFDTTANAIYARVRALRRQGVVMQARRATRDAPMRPSKRPNGPARRKCLTCGETFRSAHIGNRICLACMESDLF